MGVEMGSWSADIARITREAKQVCAPYGIDVYSVDLLAEAPGGGAVVSLRIPEGMPTDSLEAVRALPQAIPGVEMVVIEQPPGRRR
jgi:hypothetical protein